MTSLGCHGCRDATPPGDITLSYDITMTLGISCPPEFCEVSGCLGDDQPRSFDHLRSIPSASALRDRWREHTDCAGAAARLADAVEARADVVSATTMRDRQNRFEEP